QSNALSTNFYKSFRFSIELPKEEFAYIYRMYAGSVLANENLSNEYLKKAVEQMFENIYTTFYT
ncbi:hypothetical protein, partial [Tetragenococcus halophilus]